MVILAIVSSVIIMVGVVIGALTLDSVDDGSRTEINFTEETLEGKVEFREMMLHPGETAEYTVHLTNEIEGACRLGINFDEYKPNLLANELKEYVYVTVTLGDKTVCKDVLLKDLFSTELPVMDCVLDAKKPVELAISFHMPVETGNEAEFTEAFFDLVLNISNE